MKGQWIYEKCELEKRSMAEYWGRSDQPGRQPTQRELQQRFEAANRRMEDSSRRCVELVHETMGLANETSEELEAQAEALERTERRLDEMDVALESSKRNMREVRSVFGGFVNSITKPQFRGEKPPPSSKSSFFNPFKKSNPKDTGSYSGSAQKQAKAVKQSTGNTVVDRNLDQLEAGLKQLEGQAHLMGHQLDDSNVQIDRISWKMAKNEEKLKSVTRSAHKELYS